MTAHNWPIGEPIETDESEVIATIHHVDEEGFMSGTTAHYGEFVRVALWNERGESITTRNTNLIPPKRKPRTVDVWVDWRVGVVFTSEPSDRWDVRKYTITHPDDIPPPITREELRKAIALPLTSAHECIRKVVIDDAADAAYTLIESRQNNPEDRG